jgi:iron complex outermembrane receptor protein
LVNFLIKRAPTSNETAIRTTTLSYGPSNNRLIAADLGGRFGQDAEFGYRFNVASEELDPYIQHATGHRDLVSLAIDWRIDPSNRLEWEFEQSHHEQIGVNFYSLFGAGVHALPPTVDGTRNITQQPSSQPGVFDGLTGSIRLKHQLENGWLWNTQYGVQHLRADDRLTYASGCATGPSNRFCANGDFQIHDFSSNNEQRNNEAIKTEILGQTQIGDVMHNIKLNAMRQHLTTQLPNTAADTLLGSTNAINGGLSPVVAATQYWSNTNISDENTELAINDHIQLTHKSSAWLGLRHSQLDRFSIQTDGSALVHDTRTVNTPWLALSYQPNNHYTTYASYGYGIEVLSAPNAPNYSNKGQPLPTLRSTQREVGIKSQGKQIGWQATWFDITRPAVADAGINCSSNSAVNTCTRQIDGQNHHQGIELSTQVHENQWNFGGSAMWLNARRENASVLADLNGQSPINVPKFILRSSMEYRFLNSTGLRAGLRLSHEGERNVTESGDIKLPAWTTLDATMHYDTKVNDVESSWTLAINNLANRHYWRE